MSYRSLSLNGWTSPWSGLTGLIVGLLSEEVSNWPISNIVCVAWYAASHLSYHRMCRYALPVLWHLYEACCCHMMTNFHSSCLSSHEITSNDLSPAIPFIVGPYAILIWHIWWVQASFKTFKIVNTFFFLHVTTFHIRGCFLDTSAANFFTHNYWHGVPSFWLIATLLPLHYIYSIASSLHFLLSF